MNADQVRSLQPELAALLKTFRPYFNRENTQEYMEVYIAGLLANLQRKSIEPIALAAGVPVRTLQEFLSCFDWDHDAVHLDLQRRVMDRHAREQGIGVLDASAHRKQGNKTPGVQRQWCGEMGKKENCVVAQHLLYSDNHPTNPFNCVIASDLFLPKSWSDDRERCRRAGIPDDLTHRPKWQIGVEQVETAIGNGVRFSYLTFDEEYGSVPEFWFELDRLGQRGIGEARANSRCWPKRPHYCSGQAAHASKRLDNVCRYSPVFTRKKWRRVKVRDATRGPIVWEVKAARVHLVDARQTPSRPTDRLYWLIVARQPVTGEVKYFISNAAASVPLKELLRAAFGRWRVEKWFQEAKQEAGFGSFEVRTYRSLVRHWLCSRLAMYFLAAQTKRLRGEKSADHAGAGGGGEPVFGDGDLEARLDHAGADHRALRIPSGAECVLIRESKKDGAVAEARCGMHIALSY